MNILPNTDSKEELKKIIQFIMKEAADVTTFAGYDAGIGIPLSEIKDYKDEALNYCQDFEIGILNQGFFQMSSFNYEKWVTMRKYIEDNKDDISKANFFFCSTSLVAGTSPIMMSFPFINIYHTAIGMQLIGKNGKIKRTALFQLEFGDLEGLGDAATRFLTPQFCMTPVIEKDGSIKNPLKFTPDEFNKNLFIDYSKSISAVMGNFLENADYTCDDLINSMSCVDAINLKNAASIPYDDFFRQNLTMGKYFEAYRSFKNNKKNKNIEGDADGTIFTLCGFGPSPLSQNAGVILNFASCTDYKDIIKLIDFSYTNFNGCSTGAKNSNQHYCVMGIDKVTPIEGLETKQIDSILEKPNIISVENGFIREMRGRTTHCNTVCAVYVTLIEQFAKENPDNWKIHTNWEDIPLQERNFYMLNPAIPNVPLSVFPEGWEYGVSLKDFNENPIYSEDKKKFYEYMFFIKMLTNGMVDVAQQTSLDQNRAQCSVFEKIFYYSLELLQNEPLKIIFKELFGKKTISKYDYTSSMLVLLLWLYLMVKLDLYEYIYWATGQSTVDSNGYNINMTDPYPTIWKIDLKANAPVLIAYVESFIGSVQLDKNKGKNAGEIYYENKNSYGLFDAYNQVNRWIHPFPMNKFFLWFPGIRWNNVCESVKLPSDIVFYQPEIQYQLVGKNKSNSLALTRWDNINSAISSSNVSQNTSDGRITLTIIVTVLIIIILLAIFFYFYYIKHYK